MDEYSPEIKIGHQQYNKSHRRHLPVAKTTNLIRPVHILPGNDNPISHQITRTEPLGLQGMPAALFNNASPPAMLKGKSREMDAAAAERKNLAICPTDDDAIAPRPKKPHKQSFDYIWRSAVAGGLAGSAVCTILHVLASKY